jgi:hypothetical protein
MAGSVGRALLAVSDEHRGMASGGGEKTTVNGGRGHVHVLEMCLFSNADVVSDIFRLSKLSGIGPFYFSFELVCFSN